MSPPAGDSQVSKLREIMEAVQAVRSSSSLGSPGSPAVALPTKEALPPKEDKKKNPPVPQPLVGAGKPTLEFIAGAETLALERQPYW